MDEENLVGMLREITEEGDINSILKTTLGGYTKKSVMDYLATVKKQQKSTKDSYMAEIDRLQEEKEALRLSLEEARTAEKEAEKRCAAQLDAQTAQMQAAFDRQTAQMQADFDEQMAQKQQECDRLQEELTEANANVGKHAVTILQSEKRLTESKQILEATKQDVLTMQIQLDTANRKAEEMKDLLTKAESENKYLKQSEEELRAALEEDSTAELYEKIQEQMASIEQLHTEIQLREQEMENRDKRLETLTQQKNSQFTAMEQQRMEIERLSDRIEWLTGENDELGQRLKVQTEQSIEISRECARLKAAGAILQRKLDLGLSKRPAAEE